jgi:hypothetical protein
MPQGRMLNKKISYDESVNMLSVKSALLYTWCIPHLDIKGRIIGTSEYLKGNIVPFKKEIKTSEVPELLKEMENLGLVKVYGQGRYIQFNGFFKNQTLHEDREAKSIIPEPNHDKLMSNSCETPQQVNISKDKLSKVKVVFPFEEIISKYPNKDGQKLALKYFNSSVKTEQDWQDINKALENYLQSDKVKAGYIKNASTFFNNWRDWIDFKGTSKKSLFERNRDALGIGKDKPKGLLP